MKFWQKNDCGYWHDFKHVSLHWCTKKPLKNVFFFRWHAIFIGRLRLMDKEVFKIP